MKAMLSRVLAAAVAVGAVAVPQVAQASAGPFQMPGTNHWYQVFDAPLTWDDAKAFAHAQTFESMTGHLVTITSQEESDFVFSISATKHDLWAGAGDDGPTVGYARTWKWLDGPEVGQTFTQCTDYTNASSCTNTEMFTRWPSFYSQPDNYSWNGGTGQNRLHLNWWVYGNVWDDAWQADSNGFVVEFEPNQSENPPTIDPEPEVVLSGLVDARGITVGANDDVIVADFGGYKVYRVRSDGSASVIYSGPGKPHGASELPDGRVLVALYAGGSDAGNILEISPVGSRRLIPINVETPWPHVSFVVPSGDGSVLVLASGDFVRRYSADFSASRSLLTGNCVANVAADPRGRAIVNSFGDVNCGPRPEVWNQLWGITPDDSVSLISQGDAVIGGPLAFDSRGRWYAQLADGQVSRGVSGSRGVPIGRLASPGYSMAIVGDKWLYVTTSTALVRYRLALPSVAPEMPGNVKVAASDSQAVVSWALPSRDGGSPVTGYQATAFPGGNTCTTQTLSCTVTGLTNRQFYTFTVTAINDVGTSEPSVPSAAVMPLAPGFQAWPVDNVVAVGSSTTLRFAQAAANASIAVTGAAKATVNADSAGFGNATFTATKAGIQKFTATYSVKVGKKTTKYTATTQLYVPSLSGPMLKIKQGKTGKFSLQFMPPGAAVSIALSDGRTLTGTADSAGKASFTPTFNTLGAATYAASVAGVQVGTGGLTVTK